VQLPRQFENECQKIRQEQFFMTLRRVNLGVFSASTRIFMNCDPLSSMAKAHRCNILADCHIGGTDEQKLFLDSSFSSQENGKTSRLCPPDSSSSSSPSLVITSENR